MKKVLFLLVLCLVTSACTKADTVKEKETTTEETEAVYENITAEEAKKIMDTKEDYVILDVREQSEFDEGHIEGAMLIPHGEIENKAEEIIPDKNTLLLVYCRSGRRSKIASEALVELGYTNIREFGGIIDWKYGVVK